MPKKTPEQLYEESERALIGEAIAETEQEIFDDALNLSPDDNDADTSLEEMDGEDVLDTDEVEEDEEEEEGEDDGEDREEGEGEGEEPEPVTRHQEEDRRGIPSSRLREETAKAKAAEAERGRLEAEARELRARLDALERGQTRPRQDQQDQPQEPDMFADPAGWAKHQEAKITRQFEERRINSSFAVAEEEHGDKFRDAFQGLQRTGNPALVAEIVNSHNPGKMLMRWHERQALMSEIGNDPAAYREKVRQELLADPQTRRAVISGARNEALRGDGNGQARTRTRLPPSLNSATGGTSHRGEGRMNGRGRDTARTTRSEEQEIFDYAFED